jgi:hypothetical protein
VPVLQGLLRLQLLLDARVDYTTKHPYLLMYNLFFQISPYNLYQVRGRVKLRQSRCYSKEDLLCVFPPAHMPTNKQTLPAQHHHIRVRVFHQLLDLTPPKEVESCYSLSKWPPKFLRKFSNSIYKHHPLILRLNLNLLPLHALLNLPTPQKTNPDSESKPWHKY